MLSITIGVNNKKFIFSQIGIKTIYLTKGFCRDVFMNIKLEHASIIDKNISSFAYGVMEIFNFFVGKVTFGSPCIWTWPTDVKSQFTFKYK